MKIAPILLDVGKSRYSVEIDLDPGMFSESMYGHHVGLVNVQGKDVGSIKFTPTMEGKYE